MTEHQVNVTIRKYLDDIVIILTVALSFVAAIIFSVMMSRGQFFPPTLLAMLLGVSVSALTYRFLGGTDGTKFSVGLLGLGGSAALLLGITLLVGERLKSEFKIYDDSRAYLNEIKALGAGIATRDSQLADAAKEISALEDKIRKLPQTRIELNLDYIKKLNPGDDLIATLKRMVRTGEYPFVDTLKRMPARVAVVGTIGDRATYNICRNTYDDLYRNSDPNSFMRISRSKGEDGEPVSELLDRAGFIDEDICTSSKRQFDVQIGCAAAMRLFSDKVKSCAETASLRGEAITLSALPND
jgi:hypothetical protein